MAPKEDVLAFLATARKLIDEKSVLFVPRQKNMDGLVDLGITKQLAIREVRGFTEKNYSRGPDADRDVSGQYVWVFGCDISGIEAYVKLIREPLSGGRERLKVLSFHPAAQPLAHPY